MEEDSFDLLGDDGELLPRKPKPIEGIKLRTVIVVVTIATSMAAVIGSLTTLYFVSTLTSTANETTSSTIEEGLASTIEAIQSTQIAIADSAFFVNSLATQAARMYQTIPVSTSTPLPPDQCYCDRTNCMAGNAWMETGDTLISLGIQSSNPEEFGWYMVRNLSETSGVHWEVYPATHMFTCEAHWSNCQVRGFYTTRECVLSQKYRVCDDVATCRFSEPLLDRE